MPKVVKKSEKPDSSVSKELKKFLKSASGSETIPDVKRKISPDSKDNVIDEVLINHNNSNEKKSKKVTHQYKELHQKLINMVEKQSDLRKQGKENMLRTVSAIVNEVELDFTNYTEGNKIFQQRTIDHLKFLDHSATVMSVRMQAMKDISCTQNKICCLGDYELEGLLTKGAIKPDDRPIWFDVYKRFPPAEEPKFARPKPDKPIRPIFYKEDIARAKIHSQGFGLGAVNLLIPAGDTHTKKLLQQYEKLKAEGIPEDEIVEKCAILVDAERKKEFPSVKVTTETINNSGTQQVLAEADIKNIFDEEKK